MPIDFYITTPIYYVNAPPHLGTLYSTVLADSFARHRRILSRSVGGLSNTFFLTGLDEHGQKIERAAHARRMSPSDYCNDMAGKFLDTWAAFSISNDEFIRTSSQHHRDIVKEAWLEMWGVGDIYLGDHEGLYCVGCEATKTLDETFVTTTLDAALSQPVRYCKVHQKQAVEVVKEKNHFFRLSKYADRLLEWYATNPIDPPEYVNEVRSFVESGLRDISISRTNVKWAIPVPSDDQQTIYVWFDALMNYITPIGGVEIIRGVQWKKSMWSNVHHLIGKDILRFHAVYWPAILMSLDLPLPKKILCHGFIKTGGDKISKSGPKQIDPNELAKIYGAEAVRYFLLREYPLGADGAFTMDMLRKKYEADLANDLGNLLNRTVVLAVRALGGKVPARPAIDSHDDFTTAGDAILAISTAEKHWDTFRPSKALEETWKVIHMANVYFDRHSPWRLAEAGELDELAQVLGMVLEMIRRVALLISPAMPRTSIEILRQIGRPIDIELWSSGSELEPRLHGGATLFGWPGGTMSHPRPLFPRIAK